MVFEEAVENIAVELAEDVGVGEKFEGAHWDLRIYDFGFRRLRRRGAVSRYWTGFLLSGDPARKELEKVERGFCGLLGNYLSIVAVFVRFICAAPRGAGQ